MIRVNSLARAFALAASASFVPLTVAAQPVSNPYNLGYPHPWGIVAGDVTGDGKVDLVFAANYENSGGIQPLELVLAPGNNDGTFSLGLPPWQAQPGSQETFRSVALADLNGDGRLDIVLLTEDPASGASILYSLVNNGNGGVLTTFRTVSRIVIPGTDAALAVGDLNHDGAADAVVAVNRGAGWSLSVYGNDRQGALSFAVAEPLPSWMSSVSSRGLLIADVTGDGVPDVVAAGGDTVIFFPGLGLTTDFGAGGGSNLPSGCGIDTLTLSASVVYALCGNDNSIRQAAATTQGIGAWSVFRVPSATDWHGFGLVVRDLNNDGIPDAFFNRGEQRFGPSIGQATLALGMPYAPSDVADIAIPRGPSSSTFPGPLNAVVDVNGDGLADFISINAPDSSITVFLQPAAPAVSLPPSMIAFQDVYGQDPLTTITATLGANPSGVTPRYTWHVDSAAVAPTGDPLTISHRFPLGRHVAIVTAIDPSTGFARWAAETVNEEVHSADPGPAGPKGDTGNSIVPTILPPGVTCPAGGVALTETQPDGTAVGTSSYVCNGAAGVAGRDGTNGTNGTNGKDGVSILAVPEPPGANCATGGEKLTPIFGDGSVAGGASFVCNGLNGLNGTNGTNGKDGAPGSIGPQGPAGEGLIPNSFLFLAQGTAPPKGYAYVGSYKQTLPAGPGPAAQITIDVYRKQ